VWLPFGFGCLGVLGQRGGVGWFLAKAVRLGIGTAGSGKARGTCWGDNCGAAECGLPAGEGLTYGRRPWVPAMIVWQRGVFAGLMHVNRGEDGIWGGGFEGGVLSFMRQAFV
jgi:hypothetical protein